MKCGLGDFLVPSAAYFYEFYKTTHQPKCCYVSCFSCISATFCYSFMVHKSDPLQLNYFSTHNLRPIRRSYRLYFLCYFSSKPTIFSNLLRRQNSYFIQHFHVTTNHSTTPHTSYRFCGVYRFSPKFCTICDEF